MMGVRFPLPALKDSFPNLLILEVFDFCSWRRKARMGIDYIVVEGKANTAFLEKVLPSELLKDVQIVGMNGWSSAFSLASTIMSERSRPVLLVVESTSSDGGSAQERELLDIRTV
jgi:hypothetical protein